MLTSPAGSANPVSGREITARQAGRGRQPSMVRPDRLRPGKSGGRNARDRRTKAFLRKPVFRMLFLLPAGAALLVGLNAGLQLLGADAPVKLERFPEIHGMLLVLSFVGTVIALERSVALGKAAGYASPALLGAAGLLMISPLPLWIGKVALLAGTVAMVLVYIPLWRRQCENVVLIQILGGVTAVGAAALWLRIPSIAVLLPFLVSFVVLTIAGERLELARIGISSRKAEPLLTALAFALTAAAAATLLWPAIGYPLFGLALLTMVGWLVGFDAARKTIRSDGLPRYIAACLLAGYGWLAVAGVGLALQESPLTGASYDVVVHSVFLGFTISMIMAHAPVILPAVLRKPLPYTELFWVPAVLLHGSLLLRLGMGDAAGVHGAWVAGGVLNVTAILLFAIMAVYQATRPPKVTQ
ncbi:M50 family metallopeptidase [Arthrobacter alpinus]|uniref:M50 family metallopeptidase n=1 Tax=Arthrobacter alpinus TaxID=656366 RepID=UPI0021BD7BB4|nr:M50 family metallopeptidase [Arthrobacter alpinus]